MEDELATTQKFAGIPVRLPYDQENATGSGSGRRDGQLSPPELLKQPPVSSNHANFNYLHSALKLEKSAISKVQKPNLMYGHIGLSNYTNLLTLEALKYIDKQSIRKEQPFFLYWAPDSTHGPTYSSSKFSTTSQRPNSPAP